MKKIVSMFLCVCMAIGLACMATGCGNDEVLKRIDDLQAELQLQKDQLDELQAAIDEQANRLEELELKTTQGAFYTLKEAYEYGYLTKEQLKSIAYYNNGGRKYNETIMSESYTPLLKTPEVLSEETELKIKNTAAKEYREKLGIKNAEAKGFQIVEYHGTYGGCIPVLLFEDYSGMPGIEWLEEIDGVNFYFNGRNIEIWREL